MNKYQEALNWFVDLLRRDVVAKQNAKILQELVDKEIPMKPIVEIYRGREVIGGGKVTIGGLGYTGALDATKGAPNGTYVGSTLAQTVESNASSALTNAAKAQSTADGKITTFYQTTAPIS